MKEINERTICITCICLSGGHANLSFARPLALNDCIARPARIYTRPTIGWLTLNHRINIAETCSLPELCIRVVTTRLSRRTSGMTPLERLTNAFLRDNATQPISSVPSISLFLSLLFSLLHISSLLSSPLLSGNVPLTRAYHRKEKSLAGDIQIRVISGYQLGFPSTDL